MEIINIVFVTESGIRETVGTLEYDSLEDHNFESVAKAVRDHCGYSPIIQDGDRIEIELGYTD